MSASSSSEIVTLLAAVQRKHAGVPFLPEYEPADLDAAYAVQAEVAQSLGAAVAGWKAGFNAAKVPVAAPLYAGLMGSSGAKVALPRHTPLIVEAEIGFRLAADLPPRPSRPYSRADVLACVAEVLVGFELIASRFGEPAKLPYAAFLADNLGNAGYVAGDALRDFSALDLAALRCTLTVDGATVHDKVGGHPQNDPVLPLVAYANAPMDKLGGFRAGQVVTTGSVALMRFSAPAEVSARIAGIGEVRVSLRSDQ